MDAISESLLRLVGSIDGKIDGILREQNRLGAQIEQHLADDRDIHARQDDRLLSEIKAIMERFAELRDESQREAGARSMAEKWRASILTLIAAGSGYLGGLFSRWPAGHH